MKRKVMLSLFFFLVLASYFSTFAIAELKECDLSDTACKIDNGYSCLEEQIETRTCARLGSEDKVFSLIASGECEDEVVNDTNFKTSTASAIKYTALALLGGASDNDAEAWLISKNRTTDTIDWLLQIDTSESGDLICDITYATSSTVTVVFNEDKTVQTVGSNTCLTEDSTGYWLEINPTCYGKDIKINCPNNAFATNLLYRESDLETGPIYIADKTSPSGAGGDTIEKVQSLCFGSGSCDYEGTLWASLVLNSLNHDVSFYLPYLVINKDSTITTNNPSYLPEAFLSLLTKTTGPFANELLSKQTNNNKYWWVGSDKYYDTALALYALQYDDSLQKQNAQAWLLTEEAQSAVNGCWNNGNVRDTAFILYAIDPRNSPFSGGGTTDDGTVGNGTVNSCETSGNYCMSGISCSQADGNVISGLSCSGTFVCCDRPKVLESCSAQNGDICSVGKNCVGGTEALASDVSSNQICCISGSCETPSSSGEGESSACKISGGECRIGSCLTDETESLQSCEFSTDLCCVQQESGKTISSLWIWVLLSLIALSILGIIFRSKLHHILFRIKSGFSGNSSSAIHHTPRFPPSGLMPQRIMPRQIQPQTHHVPPRQSSGSSSELKDVLKKLKEMGK